MASFSRSFTAVAFTKIRSSDYNSNWTAMETFLNVTKINDDNIQDAGITRATKLKVGTVKSFVINNDTTGAMSELTPGNDKVIITTAAGVPSSASQLAASMGGTGANLSPSTATTDDVIKVSGGVFVIGAPPTSRPEKLFRFFNFS